MKNFILGLWGVMLFLIITFVGLTSAGVNIHGFIEKDNSKNGEIVELFKNGESIVRDNIIISKTNGWHLDTKEKYFIKKDVVIVIENKGKEK